jgi:hypothetical protein
MEIVPMRYQVTHQRTNQVVAQAEQEAHAT